MKKGSKDVLYKVENVSKVFGTRYILNNISFEIKLGEIFGVIGTSGSGKTSVLNLLVGFIKAEKGKILCKDLDNEKESFFPIDKNINKIKKWYGFASQNPSFYPNLTVTENMKYFGSLYNLSKEEIKLRTNNLLTLMDLKQSQHVLGANLSGGMQRRLDISCSLIHDPKILILDEPTADLDPVLSEQIWNLIKIINHHGTTIILSSHHLSQLEDFCDKLIILKDNQIVAQGKPSEIKAKTSNEEKVFLECFPGDYKKIIAELKKPENSNEFKDVKKYEIEEKALIITLKSQSSNLPRILNIIDKLGEKVTNIEIIKPKLDQVFITINKDNFKSQYVRKNKKRKTKFKKGSKGRRKKK